MSTLIATVKHGRLVLDEPTDLPEGAEVALQEADPFVNMHPEERERLHAGLEVSERDIAAGRTVPPEQVFHHR